jgi:hypothetical protein
MAARKVTTAPTGLDHAAVATGLGELKHGNGYDRLVVDGKTLAYIKKDTVTVKTSAVAGAPKKAKLPEFTLEKNGQWAGAKVDNATARRVLEYIVGKAAQA